MSATSGIDGNHGGTKIENHTSSVKEKYPYDQRFYLPLDDDELAEEKIMHGMDKDQYQTRNNKLQLRISLFYANFMNIPTEVGVFPDQIQIPHKQSECYPVQSFGTYNNNINGTKQSRHLKHTDGYIYPLLGRAGEGERR